MTTTITFTPGTNFMTLALNSLVGMCFRTKEKNQLFVVKECNSDSDFNFFVVADMYNNQGILRYNGRVFDSNEIRECGLASQEEIDWIKQNNSNTSYNITRPIDSKTGTYLMAIAINSLSGMCFKDTEKKQWFIVKGCSPECTFGFMFIADFYTFDGILECKNVTGGIEYTKECVLARPAEVAWLEQNNPDDDE